MSSPRPAVLQEASPAGARMQIQFAKIPASLILFVILGLSCLCIVSTYSVFNQTYDEPAHIAAGMEWLDRGTYHYDPQHSPLARVFAALGLYVGGIRSAGRPDMWTEGNALLSANGAYWQNLTRARIGILPFFVLTGLATFFLCRRVFGQPAAILATLLFSFLPSVLAHAGLATADIAATATYVAAIWAFMIWIENPSGSRSAVLGAAISVAVLARLSNIPILMVSFPLIGILSRRRIQLRPVVVAAAVAILVLLAGYRFSLSPILDANELARARELGFGFTGKLRDLQFDVVSIPIPGSQFLRGLYRSYEHNSQGHAAYLMGEYRETGWWYFFLVGLLFKTPLGFLILAAIGLYFICQKAASWKSKAIAVSGAAVLLVCSFSRINLGVRHLLPLYPALAMAAAFACVRLWHMRSYRILARAFVCAMVFWSLASSARNYPDHLAYFNELAGAHPERILAGSDLDWGQDLNRLSLRLRELGVREVTLKYAGTTDLALVDLPPHQQLQPGVPTTGYIAISMRYLTLDEARAKARGQAEGPYSWLKQHTPLEKIGGSILLYKL